MKIAFDYQAFFMQEFGGISRYYGKLADSLNSYTDVEAKIFAPLHVNAYLSMLPPGVVMGHDVRHRRKRKKLFRAINKFASRYQLFRYRPDLVHETYYAEKSVAPKDVPLVVTVYDMVHELFADMFPRQDRTSVWKRETVQRADHVICISQCTRNDLVEIFNIPVEKVSVVYIGFEDFKSNEITDPPLVIALRKPYLLYVGQRSGYKNFISLITAYSKSERLKKEVAIVCFGDSPFRSHELQLFAELGLSPDQIVHVTGDDRTLAHAYRNAVAHVYPSLYEGFGIPPLEAMSLSCPVICSYSSSIPEVVGDAAEYFDPLSTESILDSLERVLFSSTRRSDLIKAGLDRYRIFTWQRCSEETLRIYQGLLH